MKINYCFMDAEWKELRVSPVISTFLTSWGDSIDTAETKHFDMGDYSDTVGNEKCELARAWRVVDWLTRSALPTWMRAADFHDLGDSIEALDDIESLDSLLEAKKVMRLAHTGSGSCERDRRGYPSRAHGIIRRCGVKAASDASDRICDMDYIVPSVVDMAELTILGCIWEIWRKCHLSGQSPDSILNNAEINTTWGGMELIRRMAGLDRGEPPYVDTLHDRLLAALVPPGERSVFDELEAA